MVLKTVSTLGGAGGGGGGGGTPGGANSTIQFNNAGSFGGSANLTWDGGNVQIGSSGIIKLSNGVTNYVGFNAPTIIPANVTWTLPSTDGATGNFLITNGSGTLSWAAANLTPIAPSNYALPVVSGNTTVGQTLSSTTGSWNGYPAPTYAYQWVRGASNIANATSATYPLVDLDYNNTIKVIVIASNSAGNATANSVATANIAGTVPGAPTIGTATAGNAQASVSFTANAVTGGPNVTIYTATSNPENITGTNNVSPVTVSGLTNGNSYTFTVTATNIIGTSLPSAASNSVTPTLVVQDPSFTYVPLLLETTSTNGQNNQGTTTTNGFLDSGTANGGVGFTITRNGTPTQGSITPYWPNGQWSNLFAANGDYISVPDAANLELGASDFQMSAWIYLTAYPANNNASYSSAILSKGNFAGTRSYEFTVSGSSGNTLNVALTNAAATSTNINGSFSFALNTWYAVRATRVSNRVYLFVNGTLLNAGGTAYTDTISNGTDTLKVGRSNLDATYVFQFFGYVSNVSLAIGGSGYSTANYTPATTPTTTVTSDIKFLSCQSNRFIDNSSTPATITVTGTPTVQAFQPFSPAASYSAATYAGSGYFNGSTDYLSFPNNAAFTFGTGNFTVECWLYRVGTGTGVQVYESVIGGNAYLANHWNLYVNSSNNTIVWFGNDGVLRSTGNAISNNSWNHVAVSRSSSVLKIFVNGVEGYSATVTASYSLGASGGRVAFDGPTGTPTDNKYFYGYIANTRVVNGTAVYTGAFTPPTLAPLTTAGSTSAASYSNTTNVNTSFAAANTSLLLNFTNAGIYDAAAQNLITTVADAQVSSTITPQWGTTSMKFDGTGDWLTALDSPQLRLGTGDFTIEGWFYLSLNNTAYGIVSKGAASTGWSVNVTSGNRIQFSYTAANLTGSTTTLAQGSWYYFAVVRSGTATGNLKIYLNGNLEVTSGGAVNDNFNQTDILYVGASRTGTTALNGYLQDIRITKAARPITASPTAPFPVQ
jgi:hypothetical protein